MIVLFLPIVNFEYYRIHFLVAVHPQRADSVQVTNVPDGQLYVPVLNSLRVARFDFVNKSGIAGLSYLNFK